MGRKMYSGYSVVKHDSYQYSLSKGLTESDRSAMYQYTTLLSHFTVTALRPERIKERESGKRRKETGEKFHTDKNVMRKH